jgi:O-antigen/teichoic acid export membrane protein
MYAAAYQIANAPIVLFVGVTNQFLVPLIFERAGMATTAVQIQASMRLLYRALVSYIGAILFFVATAYYFAEPLIVALTSAEFAPAAHLLWLICAGLGLASIGQLLVIKGLCYNRPQRYIWPKVLQTFALLVTALVLVGPLGLTGIALALCVSGTVYISATVAANHRIALPDS